MNCIKDVKVIIDRSIKLIGRLPVKQRAHSSPLATYILHLMQLLQADFFGIVSDGVTSRFAVVDELHGQVAQFPAGTRQFFPVWCYGAVSRPAVAVAY
jgi:hypothetical protein